jgi:hypothetical protein
MRVNRLIKHLSVGLISFHVITAPMQVFAQPLDAHLLDASQLPWVKSAEVDRVTNAINAQLDRHMRELGIGRTVEWRMDTVTDFRGQTVPSISKRLIRWDRRPPSEIFMTGFRPRSYAEWVSSEFDLFSFVTRNQESILYRQVGPQPPMKTVSTGFAYGHPVIYATSTNMRYTRLVASTCRLL